MRTKILKSKITIALIGIATLALLQSSNNVRGQDTQNQVDFRYAPPEWQTAICLPDDPEKSLVDKSGELLYHYHHVRVGREFGTRIGVQVATNAVWRKQEIYSPRVPIVRTYRSAPGLEIVEEAFAVTDPTQGGRTRNDLILVHITNTSPEKQTVSPKLIVDTTRAFQQDGQLVVVNGHETIASSLTMSAVVGEAPRREIPLQSLTLKPGKTADCCVRYSGGAPDRSPVELSTAAAARDRAVQYWQKAPLPYGRIEVPDSGIQAMVDSSIRNIWQAREIKKGLPVFQVGPTEYRSLWIVDGAFLLEAATMLGEGQQARNGVTSELSRQKPTGAFEVLARDYYKENGIVIWTCVRHALLTQDNAWLESVWPKLEAAAAYIKELRKRSRQNNTPLDDGLIPPGAIDGGLWGRKPEFSNSYWNLIGLRAFIQAARWLGKSDEADAWQKEYDDFMATFRKAAVREMSQDARGNSYLPILMGEAGKKELPQRAQWCFCHAVYPGQLFAKDDPLVADNMAMLAPTEREGMVYGTGWQADGIWTYFASFYAHAWLWQGNGRKAAEVLYAYANHAAPMLDWREEQALRGEPFKMVGDMPHNWASAEFIRLTIHLLALDRSDELHLFEGVPAGWTGPGMRIKLNGIATPFGPLTMQLQIAQNGKSAKLHLEPLSDPSCRKVVVHLSRWASPGPSDVIELDPGKRTDRGIPLSRQDRNLSVPEGKP